MLFLSVYLCAIMLPCSVLLCLIAMAFWAQPGHRDLYFRARQREPRRAELRNVAPRQGSDKVFTPQNAPSSRSCRTRRKLHSQLKPNENGNYVNESWPKSHHSAPAEPSHWQAFKIFEQTADN